VTTFHQVGATDGNFRFVGRSAGAAKNRAAAIFFEAIGVMRCVASRAVFPFAFDFSSFCPAIRADWVQFRCLSW
jgi:hypothetical protein